MTKEIPKITIISFEGIAACSRGGAVRVMTIAETLVKLGFEVSILSLDELINIPEPQYLPSGIQIIRLPFQIPFLLGWEAIKLIRSAGKNSDAIIVESALLLIPVKIARIKKPIIWDTNELETLHYRRLPTTPYNFIKQIIWWVLEQWAIQNSSIVVAISDTEAKWWTRIFPRSKPKLLVLDHSIGFHYKKSISPSNCQSFKSNTNNELPIVLFVGNLTGKHNRDAAHWVIEDLAPKISSHVQLVLAGPGSELLPQNSHVSFLGYIDNIDLLISSSFLCIAPLITGAGVKTKVLHYIALHKRVLATPMALEGIEDAPGVISCNLNSFGTTILELLITPETPSAQASRENAQTRWYEKRCGINHFSSQLEAILSRPDLRIPNPRLGQ